MITGGIVNETRWKIAEIEANCIMNNKEYNELKTFIKTYSIVKSLYPATQDYVRVYNKIRYTNFTTEQLEKYLLLV